MTCDIDPQKEAKDRLRLKSWDGVVETMKNVDTFEDFELGVRELCNRSTSSAKIADSVEPVLDWFVTKNLEDRGETLDDFIENMLIATESEKGKYVEQETGMFVKVNQNQFNIEWNGMKLPINSELYNEWSLSKKMYDAEELIVPVRIIYVPDEDWDEFLNKHFPMPPPPENDMKSPDHHGEELKYWWQKHMTRGISYRGRIYIKKSAHGDRALLLHELGHTVPFLDHSDVFTPGIMNPMSPMWQIEGENIR